MCDETARRTFSDLLATAHWPALYEVTVVVYALVMNRQPILQDDSVTLMPLRADEFEELLAVASDPLIWAQHPNPDRWKREIFRTYFDGALASGGAFMIRDKAHRNAIGSTRFYDHDAKACEIKIGYTFFSRDQWGSGSNQRVCPARFDWSSVEVSLGGPFAGYRDDPRPGGEPRGLGRRGSIAESAVRSNSVVVMSPLLDQHLGLA